MSLLDTNVVSALMSTVPSASVAQWMDGEDSAGLYISSVTVAELAVGIEGLPAGKRRRTLRSRLAEVVQGGFDQRVLDFDTDAAYAYAEILSRRKRLGRPIAILDAQIAAIARANRLRVATRNTRDFEDCGVDLVNPFESGA